MVGICRLCATVRKSETLTKITSADDDLCRKLRQCCRLDIQMEDSLPKCVCADCLQGLQTVFEFQNRIHESQETLAVLFATEKPATQTVVRLAKRISHAVEKDPIGDEQTLLNEILSKDGEPLQDIKSEEVVKKKLSEGMEMLGSDEESQEEDLLQVYQVVEMLEDPSSDKECEEPEELQKDELEALLGDTGVAPDAADLSEEELLEEEEEEGEREEEGNNEETVLYIDTPEEGLPDGQKEDAVIRFRATTAPATTWKTYTWRCFRCAFKGSSFVALRRHTKRVHGINNIKNQQYKCNDCLKVCVRYYAFLNHVRTHHHESLILCCDVCSGECRDFDELAMHRIDSCSTQAIEDDFPFVFLCNMCGKSFFTQMAVTLHKQKQHLDGRVRFVTKCDECGKEFRSVNSLRAHQRVHSDSRDFTCDVCGRSFRHKVNLEVHLYSHISKKAFECMVCNKSFKTSVNLEKHILIHTNSKQYKCDYCDKTFRTKDTKNSHERTHTGEMPYKCKYCDRRFRFRSTYIGHTYQHTGERPYSCKDCDHHFTNWSNFNKHMRRRHNMKAPSKNPGRQSRATARQGENGEETILISMAQEDDEDYVEETTAVEPEEVEEEEDELPDEGEMELLELLQ